MRNVVPRQGTEIFSPQVQKKNKSKELRNVVPRQGTEIFYKLHCNRNFRIEKCSSPTGDGNKRRMKYAHDLELIEKCSSPTGDGNFLRVVPLI